MSSESGSGLVICPFDETLLRKIRYKCSCGVSSPLCKMYFCRHCMEIRCWYCVSHEVDSHYCPNCLENMPSAEARLKKNRCANCFDCPSCGHTLITKATGVHSPDKSALPKRVYYLSCAFCRWTSRDIGLPDQNVASGGWPDHENPFSARISALQEHYRSVAQREKLEKESKRYIGRKPSYFQLSDKYGLARKRAGLPPLTNLTSSLGGRGLDDEKNSTSVDVTPAEAKSIEEIEDLSQDFFEKLPSKSVDLYMTTKMPARLAQVDTQPSDVKDLFPRHKHLMIKRSQRCRKCEHNLSKPEYNPTSIKFKIQLAAFYHVPEIVIYRCNNEDWVPGVKAKFILKFVNPTQHATNLEFLSMEQVECFELTEKNRKKEAEEQDPKPPSLGSLLRQPSIIVASDRHKIESNAQCLRPDSKIFLPPRDDAAEFDEAGPDLKGAIDDRSIVVWRKGNKVGVVFHAIPDKKLRPGDEVITVFGLKFLYTNTVSALEQREVQTADIIIPVYINLGTIKGKK